MAMGWRSCSYTISESTYVIHISLLVLWNRVHIGLGTLHNTGKRTTTRTVRGERASETNRTRNEAVGDLLGYSVY